jgi:hypothetical protein
MGENEIPIQDISWKRNEKSGNPRLNLIGLIKA